MKYEIPIDDLLIDSKSIGINPTQGGECVLGIFESTGSAHIYIGAVGMLNYYVIYDMTPYDEDSTH